MYARYPAHSHSILGAPRSMTARPAKMATAVMTTLDRYAAWNANFVPVAPDPHSGPRRAKRARKTLSTSRGLRSDVNCGARDWSGTPGERGVLSVVLSAHIVPREAERAYVAPGRMRQRETVGGRM